MIDDLRLPDTLETCLGERAIADVQPCFNKVIFLMIIKLLQCNLFIYLFIYCLLNKFLALDISHLVILEMRNN